MGWGSPILHMAFTESGLSRHSLEDVVLLCSLLFVYYIVICLYVCIYVSRSKRLSCSKSLLDETEIRLHVALCVPLIRHSASSCVLSA